MPKIVCKCGGAVFTVRHAKSVVHALSEHAQPNLTYQKEVTYLTLVCVNPECDGRRGFTTLEAVKESEYETMRMVQCTKCDKVFADPLNKDLAEHTRECPYAAFVRVKKVGGE